MCLIVAIILLMFGVEFYIDGNYANAFIYLGLSFFLISFFIFRTIQYKKNKK